MKRIYLFSAVILFSLTFQSCFQDLEQDPAFDYPEQPGPPEYNPLKLSVDFDNNKTEDNSNYRIQLETKDVSYTKSKFGEAYQGTEASYILVKPTPAAYPGDISIKDTLTNIGSFTIDFWMNTPQAKKATGIVSISNTKKFWGNLDIFLDGNKSETEGFFKVHLYNGTKESWVVTKIPDIINEWVHMTFRYNSKNETFSILKNGESILEKKLEGWGEIQYNDMGDIVIGALQFQTDPSQTSATKAQPWASNYLGLLDEFKLYNKALSDEEIKKLNK